MYYLQKKFFFTQNGSLIENSYKKHTFDILKVKRQVNIQLLPVIWNFHNTSTDYKIMTNEL